jgi:hypothetical protein
LFLELNYRLAVNSVTKFLKEVVAKLPDSVATENIIKEAGFKVNQAGGDGIISGVGAAKSIYQKDNGVLLRDTLDLIVAAWGHRSAGCESKMMQGVSEFLRRYKGAFDRQSLITLLAKYKGGPGNLIGQGRGLTGIRKISLPKAIAVIITDTYNARRRVGLLDPL